MDKYSQLKAAVDRAFGSMDKVIILLHETKQIDFAFADTME